MVSGWICLKVHSKRMAVIGVGLTINYRINIDVRVYQNIFLKRLNTDTRIIGYY